MNRAVFCIASSESQAKGITRTLRESGFARDDISVLFPDHCANPHFPVQQSPVVAPIPPLGSVIEPGGADTISWTIGIGNLAIPTVGPCIAAGPLMARFTPSSPDATAGDITGALIDLGIPKIQAKRYVRRIKAGHVLVAVITDSSTESEEVKVLFRAANAHNITSTSPHPHKMPAPQAVWGKV